MAELWAWRTRDLYYPLLADKNTIRDQAIELGYGSSAYMGGKAFFKVVEGGGKAIFKVHGGGANHFSRYNFGLTLH